VDEFCLVHAGFAISLLSEEDAMETLKLIEEMEAESGVEGMFE
jgi:hydrogenase maturation factor